MKTRHLLLCLLFVLPIATKAQTMVVARPSSDLFGQAIFVVTDVLRVDGEWQVPPHPGQVLYPQRAQPAHPISRFGEAVLVSLPVAGVLNVWKGMHVHGGLVPALGGAPLSDVIDDISRTAEIEKEQRASHSTVAASKSPKQKLCPICKTVHITHLGS